MTTLKAHQAVDLFIPEWDSRWYRAMRHFWHPVAYSNLPCQLLLALPFVLTIAALVLNRSRSQAPLSLTIPYHRGER